MKCSHCGVDNPPGMRFCGGCGGLLEERPTPTVAGEAQRRHLTVMVCDLVGSTPLAGSLDPEDFRDVLTAYQRACASAIGSFDGYIAQYRGDGVLAYFGYPRAHEDNAQRAVHAGLAILDEITALNRRLDEVHGVSLKVRIGAHTGIVVAGEMGEGEARDQRAIVGETPHVAARLESIAPPGSMLISDVTRDLVDGYFETEPLGEKTLKGVSQPVSVHRVLRSTGAESRLELNGARRLTPVVDRRDEMARLIEAWQHVKDGDGRVVHLTGEAGIGKSRLVCALRDRLEHEAGAEETWQCSAHHRSTSLYPVSRFLDRFFGIDRTQAAEHPIALLNQAVLDAALEPDQAVPLLADLMSIPGVRRSGVVNLEPREVRAATLRILESLLAADPAHHPLLLTVEDLHWADPTTIELLDRIITNLTSTPVLCVLTFRPEFKPAWTNRLPDLEIELGPLESRHVKELAAAASATELDDDVLDWVDSAADGVPLFVEEMLHMLDLAGGAASVRRTPDATFVPATLQGLLTERLDRLEDLGDVIDAAAVLGREFDRNLLEALTLVSGPDFDAAMAKLAAQDLLLPVEAGARCEFKHALLQEAAYGRLLRGRRRALHSRAAEILARGSLPLAAHRPEVIAHHWSAAAEPAKAVRYWHEAGTRALDRAAFLEAAEHFRRGLEALDARGADEESDIERIDFLTHLAASLQAGRGYAAAGVQTAYAEARTRCERAGHQDRLLSVIRGEWLFYLLRTDYRTALNLADEMLALGERRGDPVKLAEGHLFRGFPEMYLANFDQARHHFGEAIALYRPPEHSDHIYEAQGDTGVMAVAYLALVLWNLGHFEESMRRSDTSLQLVKEIGGPVTRALAWGMRSILHLSRSEPSELRYWVEKTTALCTEYNIGYWHTVSSVLAAWLQGRSGKLDASISRLEESVDDYLRSGSRLSLPHFCIYLADLRLAEGDHARALDALRMGEEHIDATGERFAESELFRFKGRLLMAGDRPDTEAATKAYERAVTVAREQNARLLELRAAVRLALHQRELGIEATALERVSALCDWFPTSPELPDAVRARALLIREGLV
jgi:class 3 adenylate cyclase/tetratricopeptide (TPR) repeat protein